MDNLIAPADNIRPSAGLTENGILSAERDISSEIAAAILDSIKDAIVVLSLNGTIISANPATFELTGFGSTDLLGNSVELLIGTRQFERFIKNISEKGDLPER